MCVCWFKEAHSVSKYHCFSVIYEISDIFCIQNSPVYLGCNSAFFARIRTVTKYWLLIQDIQMQHFPYRILLGTSAQQALILVVSLMWRLEWSSYLWCGHKSTYNMLSIFSGYTIHVRMYLWWSICFLSQYIKLIDSHILWWSFQCAWKALFTITPEACSWD